MQEITSSVQPKYWVDAEQNDNHRAQLELVPAGSRVLEIGAAAGHMTQALSKKGCTVTAVERDESLAESARRFCRLLIVSDVESPEFETHLKDERFDVILLGDVLEHLREPEKLLRRLRPRLATQGCLVVCLPNIAHGSIRLTLLQGRFDYQPKGLLDQTHLRFFTLASLSSMFRSTGYTISDLCPIRRSPFDTEIPVDPAAVPIETLRTLCRDPEATTYQYVFRAHARDPADASPKDEPLSLPSMPVEDQRITSEILRRYERLGREALFDGAPDLERARRLLLRAFLLAPSAGRLRRLCLSFLPVRAFSGLARLYDRLRRQRGSR